MPHDWVVFREVVGFAKDVMMTILAGATVVIAHLGVDSWRRELRGKAHFEAARAVLRSAIRVRETLGESRVQFTPHLRGGLSWQAQIKDNRERFQAWRTHFEERYAPMEKALEDFETAMLEIQVLIGPELNESAQELRKQCRIVRNSATSYAFFGGQDIDGNDSETMSEVSELRKIIYTRDPNDSITNAVDRAVSDIESKLVLYLRDSRGGVVSAVKI